MKKRAACYGMKRNLYLAYYRDGSTYSIIAWNGVGAEIVAKDVAKDKGAEVSSISHISTL